MQLPPSELALPCALAATGAQLPSSASIYVPWAVQGCSRNSGYVPATAQEALLLRFLGERGSAALAAAAARFRSQPAPQAPLSARQPRTNWSSSRSSSSSNRSSNNCHNHSNSCRYHDNSRRSSGRASSGGGTRSTGDDSPSRRRTAGVAVWANQVRLRLAAGQWTNRGSLRLDWWPPLLCKPSSVRLAGFVAVFALPLPAVQLSFPRLELQSTRSLCFGHCISPCGRPPGCSTRRRENKRKVIGLGIPGSPRPPRERGRPERPLAQGEQLCHSPSSRTTSASSLRNIRRMKSCKGRCSKMWGCLRPLRVPPAHATSMKKQCGKIAMD